MLQLGSSKALLLYLWFSGNFKLLSGEERNDLHYNACLERLSNVDPVWQQRAGRCSCTKTEGTPYKSMPVSKITAPRRTAPVPGTQRRPEEPKAKLIPLNKSQDSETR
ncbi:hypothetical protein B0H11DRAFT_1392297 [Mycena galericulata]|nr:hypothetical protein B0H11DRAFT_576466 [Mycena galericulata]KAJ7469871.1 hypothetical protein B0H11DRAFT_1392297 [Mycena galericulata]